MTADEWADAKLSETLERIRVQLLAHLAAIARALEQAQGHRDSQPLP
jgi:hypothetical protein